MIKYDKGELMKKNSVVAIILCLTVLTISSAFTCAAPANAAGDYYRFENVTSVYADETGYAVSDEHGLHIFGGSEPVVIEEMKNAAAVFRVDGYFALTGGSLIKYSSETNKTEDVVSASVFTAEYAVYHGGTVYLASETEIRAYSPDGKALADTYTPKGKIKGLAVAGDKIYYSVQNGAYADIYEADGEAPAFTGIRSDGTIFGANGLYSILRTGDICAVDESGEAMLTENRYVAAGFAYGDRIYYATDIGELFYSENGRETLIAASESGETGYYSHPKWAAARMGRLLVCDYLNDRLAVVSAEGKTSYIKLPRPTSVCVDNKGEIYVSHSGNKITRISTDLTDTLATYQTDAAIKGLYTGNDNSLYALCGNRLTAVTGDALTDATGITSACASAGGDTVYVSKSDGVYELDGTVVFRTDERILSMAADAAGNFFMAVDRSGGSAVIRRAPDGNTSEILSGLQSNEVTVTISRAAAGGAGYGDLIITDARTSRIRFINAKDAGVVMQISAQPQLKPYDEENVIRSALNACGLYSSLNETDIAARIPAGALLIVAKYNVAEDANFSYVFYEDPFSKAFTGGFVFKSNLSEPLAAAEPPAADGVLYTSTANLYELPSLQSEKLKENLAKNTAVNLLPFADYNVTGTDWYRVRLSDGTHGYLPAKSVSVRHFIPDAVRPQYNAEIISVKDSVGAQAYYEKDGEYLPIDEAFLLVGTKVEVVGAFDTSEKYTKIKYFDEKLGTSECYVETIYIDYNNISVVQIIAIALAVITFILLIIMLVRLYMKKRKL
jgi:hypothetical protein